MGLHISYRIAWGRTAVFFLPVVFVFLMAANGADDVKPHRDSLPQAEETPESISVPPPPEVGDWGYWQINLSKPFIVPDPHLDEMDTGDSGEEKGNNADLTQKLELVLVVTGVTAEGLSVRQEQKVAEGELMVHDMVLDPESWTDMVFGSNRKLYNGGDQARTTVAGKSYPARHSEITIPSLTGEAQVYQIEEITGYNLGLARLHGPGVQITLLAFGDAATKPHTLVPPPPTDDPGAQDETDTKGEAKE